MHSRTWFSIALPFFTALRALAPLGLFGRLSPVRLGAAVAIAVATAMAATAAATATAAANAMTTAPATAAIAAAAKRKADAGTAQSVAHSVATDSRTSRAAIVVACVGDSITYGSGTANPEFESYPAQLQRLLGDTYDVRNFGVGGSTLLNRGDKPYQKQGACAEALQSSPAIVVIKLGTNDTKPQNWKFREEYEADYRELIGRFKALPTRPKIYLCRPVPVVGAGNWGINEAGVLDLMPAIDRVAASEGCRTIDLHAALAGRETLIPDRVHPNAEGAGVLARAVFAALVGRDAPDRVPERGTGWWMGYRRHHFQVAGRWCLLVEPRKAAPGKPWIWRPEFFGHEPQTELALLERGHHAAYIDVRDLYGAPKALDAMDAFYAYLTSEYRLAMRPTLAGFSRGGLFALNWAARNPRRVSSLYLDAPVCDFKSWPGGRGAGAGSKADWAKLLKAYGLSEAEALAWKTNPVDNLAPLAAARLPILSVVGDADKVVPVEENTAVVERRYRALGGSIEVIHKPGVDHHPHSLKDPTPIVDFILRHAK